MITYCILNFSSVIGDSRNHWVSVVVSHGTGGELVAYYADSFGTRPERFHSGTAASSGTDFSEDQMVLSYSMVRSN